MDTDLIRRCIERGEGWHCWERDGIIEIGTLHIAAQIDGNAGQILLDALAAEMVRMVDADKKAFAVVWPYDTSILANEKGNKQLSYAEGPNRTENTLRACDEFFNETDNG